MITITKNNKKYKAFNSLEDFKNQVENIQKFFDGETLEPIVDDVYDLACNEDNDAILSMCEAAVEQYLFYNAEEIIDNGMPDCMKSTIKKFRKEMIDRQIEAE